jgi:hypothetical protein
MKAVTGHLVLDEDIARVLHFMEQEVVADRLELCSDTAPGDSENPLVRETLRHVSEKPHSCDTASCHRMRPCCAVCW